MLSGEKLSETLFRCALLCSNHLNISEICCQCNTATTSAIVSLMGRKGDGENGAVFKFALSILLPNVEGPRRQLLAFASPALAADNHLLLSDFFDSLWSVQNPGEEVSPSFRNMEVTRLSYPYNEDDRGGFVLDTTLKASSPNLRWQILCVLF